MQDTDIPAKFSIPWGNSAGGSYIRSIPTASQIGIHDGWASLTDGFPPLNFSPVASGGIPPFGEDFNGILNQITAWARWLSAGGPIQYDATFQSAAGGYPKYAVVGSVTMPGASWLSSADNNTTNPDTGGAGWSFIAPNAWRQAIWTGGGTANALTVTLSPAPTSLGVLTGVPLRIKALASNTGATTLAVNGLTATSVVGPDGSAVQGGTLIAGAVAEVVYDGTSFLLLCQYPSRIPTQVVLTGSGTFNTPAGVFRLRARLVGGGGGGGGATGSGGGGGGGGGGYCESVLTVTAGQAITYSVGSGGTGGSTTTNGNNGGTTTFGALSATGGTGGRAGAANAGGDSGAAGAGSGGTINEGGQAGGAGLAIGSVFYGGYGGSSALGGGGAPSAGLPSGGNAAGGGGAGGANNNAGANGAAGTIIVEY